MNFVAPWWSYGDKQLIFLEINRFSFFSVLMLLADELGRGDLGGSADNNSKIWKLAGNTAASSPPL